MTHVTCRLTAKNWDQLRNTTLGNRVWATFTFLPCLGSSYSTAHFAFGPLAPPAKTLEGSGWAHLYAFARAPRTLDSPLITRLFVLIATGIDHSSSITPICWEFVVQQVVPWTKDRSKLYAELTELTPTPRNRRVSSCRRWVWIESATVFSCVANCRQNPSTTRRDTQSEIFMGWARAVGTSVYFLPFYCQTFQDSRRLSADSTHNKQRDETQQSAVWMWH